MGGYTPAWQNGIHATKRISTVGDKIMTPINGGKIKNALGTSIASVSGSIHARQQKPFYPVGNKLHAVSRIYYTTYWYIGI